MLIFAITIEDCKKNKFNYDKLSESFSENYRDGCIGIKHTA